ncbi:hypothetical protein AZI86_00705 [Bdellovibrio bacteriovorus]|uniref:Uncharacterized protein n=2 Tax=Bdellovibrio bacteriovorus TaxID=959 RepID=A0A150WMB0_BDEBC|nr:hypothetical protein AZI86_00705 [Bdellovibrio bacteriovorus]
MQSKYFNPAFNSAIFDGPIRIYFAQFHESLALKIYFMIQQQLVKEMARAKEVSKSSGANIMMMVYPTAESFTLSFDGKPADTPFETEKWNEDIMIGLRGPIEDNNLELLIESLRLTMNNWKPVNVANPQGLVEV